MKKRILSLIAVILAAVMCAACMSGCKPAAQTEFNAEEMIAGFKTNPTTVSGTWVQDFKLDVNSDNESFKSFAMDLKATVDFAMDLTAGNVYYYAKRTTDAGDSFEEIVTKADGKYFYKSTAANAVELADEAAALAKIESAFKAITTEKSGWLDLDAFLYNDSWVSNYIMLGSTNVPTTSKSYFTYTYDKTAEGGLKLDLDAKYVGYTGDSGIVDVGTNDTMTGSKLAIVTNEQGHILSMNQTVNNYIEFNITNPPIPLLYTGTRTLTASYGAVTPKTLEDVAMTATTGTVTITKDANVLKTELFDFNYGTMNFGETKSEITAGNFVALKITCGAGYDVESVLVNGVEATNMNGYYCHMTPVEAGGSYEVVITTKLVAEGPIVTTATVTVEAADGITYELYDFDYGTMGFNPTTSEVEQGHFIAVKITSEGEVSVKVDGNDATFINGYYCYMKSVEAGKSYALTITEAGETPDPGTTKGTATVEAAEGITYELYDFDYATFAFVATEGEIEQGHYIAIKITSEGEVAVKVDGNDAQFINGYYCYMQSVKAGQSYAVTITSVGGTVTPDPGTTKGTANVTASEGVTYELYDFDYATFGFTPTTGEVEAGHFIAVKITSEGEVTVMVNGVEATNMNGYYCYMTPVAAGEVYEVTITAAGQEPSTKGTVTVTASEGVTYELYDFDYATFGFTPTTGEVEAGHFIAVKVTSEGEVTVMVNGVEATNMNGYYCYMTPVAAGEAYEVTITAAAASTKGTVTVNAAEGITYELYDFDYATFGFTPTTGEVEAGHFIAVKITSEGAVTVLVNGVEATNMNGYYCYMVPVAAGEAYEVVITPAG